MKQTEGSEGVRAYDMVLTRSQLCLSEFAFLVPTHAQGFCVGTGPIWQAFSQDPRKKYHHFLICHISQCPLRPSLSKGAVSPPSLFSPINLFYLLGPCDDQRACVHTSFSSFMF